MFRKLIRLPFVFALLGVLALGGCRSASEYRSETDQVVERARITFQTMMSDNQYPGLIDLAARAKAIIIAPDMLQAGFFIGGRGGNAVMLVRGPGGQWSNPAFYTLTGLSFGLQFGGQSSEVIVTVMTEKGLNAILDRKVTLGGDAGLAIGELGKGVNAATGIGLKSDMYSFTRAQGLFVGVSIEGAVIAPRHEWNRHMYGKGVTPRNILLDHSASSNAQSVRSLISAMP